MRKTELCYVLMDSVSRSHSTRAATTSAARVFMFRWVALLRLEYGPSNESPNICNDPLVNQEYLLTLFMFWLYVPSG